MTKKEVKEHFEMANSVLFDLQKALEAYEGEDLNAPSYTLRIALGHLQHTFEKDIPTHDKGLVIP